MKAMKWPDRLLTQIRFRFFLGSSFQILLSIAQDHQQMVHNFLKRYCYHCSVLDNRILKCCHGNIFCEIKWSLFHHAEAVTCRPLRLDSKGLSVEPASCKVTNPTYLTKCRFQCAFRYMLEGPPVKTCTQSGDWSSPANTYCKGTLSPS